MPKNNRICSVDGCGKPHRCWSLCNMHYLRKKRYGDVNADMRKKRTPETCTVEGCSTKYLAKGFCSNHYRKAFPPKMEKCAVGECDAPAKTAKSGLCRKHFERLKKYGSVNVTMSAPPAEPLKFIIAASKSDTDECIVWPYSVGAHGYGRISKTMGESRAHRLCLKMAAGGPPSPNHVAAHAPIICHNRKCINPKHLRWATRKENASDTVLDGTRAYGSKTSRAKLTWEDVDSIRANTGNLSRLELSKLYGVNISSIDSVRSGRSWNVANRKND